MELLVEGLEVGEDYSVDIETQDCTYMGQCEWDYESHEFTATAENETIEFYFETDNSTCNAHVRADLMTEDDEGGWDHMGHGMFNFHGPCEQPPSPFSLTYDGMEWEMDYYHMAAFSYGMDARRYDTPNRKAFNTHQREKRKEIHEKMVGIEKFPQISNQRGLERYVDNKNYEKYLERFGMTDKEFRATAKKAIEAYEAYDHEYQEVRQAMNDLYNPLQYIQTTEVEKTLKLPHDYQYDDAKPNDPVKPSTMFGKEVDSENIDDGMIDAYAEWMTSPDNPTFTKVISNRLCKRVMGHGVFEPIDELTDNTQVANPELLAYLEEIMRELGYDTRKYLEVLYNTETYQRGANTEEIVLGMPYHFQGPVLRRMTAEQIWDSLVTLMVADPLRYRQPAPPSLLEVRDGWSALEFIENVEQGKYRLVDSRSGEEILIDGNDGGSSYGSQRVSISSGTGKKKNNLILARASELPQPAPSGHLLRKFGQSERLFVVGASNRVGSVPQLMELMNGFPTEVLTSRDSLLFRKVRSVSDPRKQAEVVFLSILNRLPTKKEQELLLAQTGSSEEDLSDLIWALLNTPEFFFIK